MLDDIIRVLPVPLTAEEFDTRAAELAAANQEIEALNLERQSAASAFKSRIEKAREKQSRLTTIVARRAENREVGCVQRINPEAKVVEIVRIDTGEIIDTRGITTRDIQEMLEFVPDAVKADDKTQ